MKKRSRAYGHRPYPLKPEFNMAWGNLGYIRAIHIMTTQHFFIEVCDSNQNTPASQFRTITNAPHPGGHRKEKHTSTC